MDDQGSPGLVLGERMVRGRGTNRQIDLSLRCVCRSCETFQVCLHLLDGDLLKILALLNLSTRFISCH